MSPGLDARPCGEHRSRNCQCDEKTDVERQLDQLRARHDVDRDNSNDRHQNSKRCVHFGHSCGSVESQGNSHWDASPEMVNCTLSASHALLGIAYLNIWLDHLSINEQRVADCSNPTFEWTRHPAAFLHNPKRMVSLFEESRFRSDKSRSI